MQGDAFGNFMCVHCILFMLSNLYNSTAKSSGANLNTDENTCHGKLIVFEILFGSFLASFNNKIPRIVRIKCNKRSHQVYG